MLSSWREESGMPESIKCRIGELLGAGGRLEYRALMQMAHETSEQGFVRQLGHWVLAGDRVMPGRITPAREISETARFDPVSLDAASASAVLPGNLAEVVYGFYRPVGADGVVEERQSFSVGRSGENDFLVPDYSVSRQQAVFQVFRGKRFWIRKMSGAAPIQINQRPMAKEQLLREGDHITLGRLRFQLLAPSSLFLRLHGIKPQARIRQFVNALGQADYQALKEYAVRHHVDLFSQLMRFPSLVGSGVVRGYASRMVGGDVDATYYFLPASRDTRAAVRLKVLGRSIYPLIESEGVDVDQEESLLIGRAVENDLVMGDDAISNRHARIVFGASGQYFLEDLNSTNGVFVNGVPVGHDRQELVDRDQIKFGRHEFTLMFPGTLYNFLTGN
ncbi:MAG: FHA domain-containing protein [Magnetococcales bacterium]|nr:FHA domain-containing protein [Magnetococcales bacterium]NGZ06106.1 FHA domain-containing protein [Magnetococcales bacterium]